MNKDILLAIALTISIAAFIVALGSNPAVQLGGTSHFSGPVDSEAGFTESGTTVIDTDRNIIGADITLSGEANLDNLIYGGDVTTLTPGDTTSTLTAAEFCNSAVLSLTPAAGNYTLTLPSTTTLAADCLPTAGDSKVVLFENAATAATSTTIAAGTGNELLEPSGGDVVIEQNEWAWIQITHVEDAQFAVIVTSLQVAD